MTAIRDFLESVRHALRGIDVTFRTERSFRIQIGAALLVGISLFIFPFARWEQILLVLATASVLVLELLNSAMERLVDVLKPRIHSYVRDIKDVMAAAVFLASFAAAILAVWLYSPHLVQMIRRV